MKRKIILKLFFVLSFMFLASFNTYAEDIIDNETPEMEQYEKEYTDQSIPKMQARSAGGLTIPTEGVYDNVKDTKDSAGVLTERRYYYKGKLVEKRTYTSTASSNCRMRNKYLYFSDGNTVERHRTYSNTGDTCYNLQTKVYNSSSKIKSHTIYEGKVNGYITEIRTYDDSGTYYIGKSYYKKGIVDKKEYWYGAKPNRITHIANFNSAGTHWTDATYYDVDGDKTSYVKYTGTDPNKKVYTLKYDKQTQEKITSTYYDANGEYINYITIWENGKKTERTYYSKDENEIKLRTVYYDNEDDTNILNIKYYNEEGIVIKEYYYEEYPHRTKEIHYYDDGKQLKEEIIYQEYDNVKDVVVKWNEEGQEIQKYRYFKDGKHLKWESTYENNCKKETKIYNKSMNDSYEIYKFTDKDRNYEIEYKNVFEEAYMEDIFDSEEMIYYLLDKVNLNDNQIIFFEDLLLVEELVLENRDNLIEIDNIDEVIFLRNLKKISLNNFDIEEISQKFNDLEKIEYVSLNNNNIYDIRGLFNNMITLKYLDLSNNNIEFLPKEIFDLFNNELNFINIDNNNFYKSDLDSNQLSTYSKYFEKQENNFKDYIYIFEDDVEDYNSLLPISEIDEDRIGNFRIKYYNKNIDYFENEIEDDSIEYDWIKSELNNLNYSVTNYNKDDSLSKNDFTKKGVYEIVLDLNNEINNYNYSLFVVVMEGKESEFINEKHLSSCEGSPYGNVINKKKIDIEHIEIEVTTYCEFENNEEAYNKMIENNSDFLDKIKYDYDTDLENRISNYIAILYEKYIETNEINDNDKKSYEAILTFMGLYSSKYDNVKINELIDEINNKANNNVIAKYSSQPELISNNLMDLYSITSYDSNKELDDYIEENLNNNIMLRSSYSKSNATKYATTWYSKVNSKYGTPSYNGDCTNFLSQILHNGGRKLTDSWWYKQIRICNGPNSSCSVMYDYSTKWINANSFVKMKGTKKDTAETKSWTKLKKYARKHYPIAADWDGDGKWDHIGYVTATKKNKKTGKKYIKIAQHSSYYHKWDNKTGWKSSREKNGKYKVLKY